MLAFFLGSRIKCKFNGAVKIPTSHKKSEQASAAGLSWPPSLLKRLPSLRFSFAVLSSFHFPQVQFEQKNRIVRKRETLSKTEIWSRSGPQLWGPGFEREPKAGTSTFPAPNICPPLPPIRLSIPASEMITAGIKEPECLLVYTTAVTETFKCPVTTRSHGSLLVCTSQMSAIEPAVLP